MFKIILSRLNPFRLLKKRHIVKHKKRFYKKETKRNIGILQSAKIPPLYHDWLRSLN